MRRMRWCGVVGAAAFAVMLASAVDAGAQTGRDDPTREAAHDGAATPRERLMMPFACRVEQGRVDVFPAPDQTYEIVGPREQLPFAACFGDTAECRAWSLQRFAVSCGGQRVAWIEIAAAAARFTPYRIRPTPNGLAVAQKLAAQPRNPRECFDQIAGGPPLAPFQHRAAMIQCWQGRWREARSRQIVLPPGFAPLSLWGARIAAPSPQPQVLPQAVPPKPAAVARTTTDTPKVIVLPPAVPSNLPVVAPKVGAAAPTVPRPDAPKVTAEETLPKPVARAADEGHSPAPAAPSGLRTTAVEATPGSVRTAGTSDPVVKEATSASRDTGEWLLALTALAGGVLLAALFAAWRRRGSASAADLRIEPKLDGTGSDAAMAALLLEGARRAMDEIQATLDGLDQSTPLRQVLAKEARAVGRRLESLATVTSAEGAAGKRHRARVQALVQDLRRLQDIAAGARQSLDVGANTASAPSPSATPMDRAAAYAVLGANPEVDATTLKKLVDALRRAWHPDLARDETDRLKREERIKQINVAWDLIQGRRLET